MLNYVKTCEYLFQTFYVQFITINTNRTVKSRQISNIHTHGFLEKCKTLFNFVNGPIKIA